MAEDKISPKKKRVMGKKIENGVLEITVVGVKKPIVADPKSLPKNVQELLPVIALSHILGDAAAGKRGTEAYGRIKEKWGAMLDGNMTVRRAKAPTIKHSEIIQNYLALSPKDKKNALPLLISLGVTEEDIKAAEAAA